MGHQAVLHSVWLVTGKTSDAKMTSTSHVSQRSDYHWQRHPAFASSGTPLVVNIEPPDPTSVLIHPALRPLFNRLNLLVTLPQSGKTEPIDQTTNPLQAQPIIDAMASIQ